MSVDIRHLKGTETEPIALFTDTGEPLFVQSTSVPGQYGVVVLNPDGSNISGGGAGSQTANTVYAGPTSGGAASPTFRSLVGADLPATITKATAFNIAGAASAPALSITGTPFAGTGTTAFPQLYINDSTATASTTLSTAGTYLGVNGHGSADLLNLMKDGVTQLKVTNAGQVRATAGYIFDTADNGMYMSGASLALKFSSVDQLGISSGSVRLPAASSFTWSSTSAITGVAADLVLVRDAANIFAQRNGVNAQQFNIYNTYTDGSNYERGFLRWNANGLELGTQALGTGTGTRTIRFYTNNTEWWDITGIGNLHAVSNLNIWNGTSALATTATAGFLGVNSCAGTPTGVPASVPTGQIPMVVDSTNSKLYAYIGGTWKGIVLV